MMSHYFKNIHGVYKRNNQHRVKAILHPHSKGTFSVPERAPFLSDTI